MPPCDHSSIIHKNRFVQPTIGVPLLYAPKIIIIFLSKRMIVLFLTPPFRFSFLRSLCDTRHIGRDDRPHSKKERPSDHSEDAHTDGRFPYISYMLTLRVRTHPNLLLLFS